MIKSGFEQYYDEAIEPGKRERAYAWATAIGLQDVDGLRPSKHLIATAKRHIEGEISQEEARRIVDEYYETKDGHDLPRDTMEADKVAARIVAVINSPTFVFSPAYLIGLHERIFEGIFPHAGKIREVELTKHEDVLNGASVEYAPSFMVMKTLEYDFDKEAKFAYKGIKVLLLGEDIELKNRFLRIGFEYGSKGAVAVAKLHRKNEKLDIGTKKIDIADRKLDIDDLSQPTKVNIKKLLRAYSTRPFFKRKDVLAILDLSPTAASDLLAKMLFWGIIEPVKGHGKGACRFSCQGLELTTGTDN